MKQKFNISGCSFQGVVYDEKMISAICSIAKALQENAISLGKLADAIKPDNIVVESMLKIEPPTKDEDRFHG